MKTIRKALLFLLLSTEVMAGDFYIAPQLAYGKSASYQSLYEAYEFELLHLFNNNEDIIFLRSGVMVSLERKWLSYTTGLLYSRAIIDEYDYSDRFRGTNILQLPLLCNLHFGNKLYGYLSIGAYLNYLFYIQEGTDPKIDIFQPGITGGIGMGYRFTSALAIDIVYRSENGFLPLYYTRESSSAGPWGYLYWDDHHVAFRTLTISLKLPLGRKNSQSLNK